METAAHAQIIATTRAMASTRSARKMILTLAGYVFITKYESPEVPGTPDKNLSGVWMSH